MMTYIKLAWRNIWRNKRRTLITVASIFFAVFFALIMRAFQIGSYDNMIYSVVETYTGHVQIHSKGYWDDRTIDNSFEINDSLAQSIKSIDGVGKTSVKLEYGALAASEKQSKFAIIMGVDPNEEQQMTRLNDKVVHYKFSESVLEQLANEGIPVDLIESLRNYRKHSFTTDNLLRQALDNLWGEKNTDIYIETAKKLAQVEGSYFNSDNDDGILIGERLAKFLDVDVGDTIVLMGTGYHAISAAALHVVRGIIWIPNPNLDNKIIYMSLPACQEFLSSPNRATSLAIGLEKPEELRKISSEIKSAIDTTSFEVMTWEEMNKELVQQIESDNKSGLLMLYLLYIIIGFGVFGTVLMMTAERKREFGVMIAIGMRKTKLLIIVFFELVILTLLGIASGTLASLPVIRYFAVNPIELSGSWAQMMESFGVEPIMPLAWKIDYFINQGTTVIFIIMLAVVYPLLKILRINIMKALRN